MITLAIDTSTFAAVASVVEISETKAQTLSEIRNTVHRSHSGSLLKMIDDALAESKKTLKDIDFFTIGAGPGSFTGLRIGLSTVKAFAKACKKPIVPVSTLEALSLNANGIPSLSVIDSRKNEVYGRIGDKEFVLFIPDLLERIDNNEFGESSKFLLIGNSAITYENEFKISSRIEITSNKELHLITGLALGGLGFREYDNYKNKSYHEALPNYIAEGPVKRL